MWTKWLFLVCGSRAVFLEDILVQDQGEALALLQARAVQAPRRSLAALRTVAGATPIPPVSVPNATTPIILEVSAFQDGERCALTLRRALERAAEPERIQFHVVQAREQTDVSCARLFQTHHLPELCGASGALGRRGASGNSGCEERVMQQAKFWTLPVASGEGPAHQRGLANMLLSFDQQDSMCLSTDSHMDFVHGWDEILLKDWASTQNEFAVLTAYVARAEDPAHPENEGPVFPERFIDLCGYFLENGIPRGQMGSMLPTEPGRAPYLTMNWAAGMSFHRCHMERAVPVDWHLRWMFTGEEIDRAVRLFTHGYDMYLPTNLAITHNYTHATQAFWNYASYDDDRESARKRLLKLLQEDDPDKLGHFGDFGLGKQRTVEDFVTWSGTDLGGRWSKFLGERGIHRTELTCSDLSRRPVRDKGALLASIGTLPAARLSAAAGARGEVLVKGDGETVHLVPEALANSA